MGRKHLEESECGGPSIFPFSSESSDACHVLIDYVPYLKETSRNLRSRKDKLQMQWLRVCAFFFFGRQDFRIPCIVLFIWQDAYVFVTVGGFPGGFFSQRFCWGLEVRGEPWNLFSYFGPKSMIVHTLFQTGTKGKKRFQTYERSKISTRLL